MSSTEAALGGSVPTVREANVKCKCRLELRCQNPDVGDGGMCHYCSHVCHGDLTMDEYWERWPEGVRL